MKGIISNVMDEEKIRQIFILNEQGLTNRMIASKLRANQGSVKKYLEMGEDKATAYVQEIKAKKTEPARERREIVLNDEIAREWLDSLGEGSRKGHVTGLAYYCEIAEKRPTELIEEARREIKQGLLISERGYFIYLNQLEKRLREQGFSPHSIQHYISTARSFYGYYQIFDMPRKNKRRSRVKPLEENAKGQITKGDIKDMLSVSKYLRDKALILTIASSGLGRAEIISLRIEDFASGYDKENNICMFMVRRKKTGTDFITFISSEATSAIWDYLKIEREIRKDNIKMHLNEALFAVTKITHRGGEALKSKLSPNSVDRIFKDIARRLDITPSMNENGNILFNRYHPHNLRKFFNTEMKNAGMPEIMVEYMMGHEIGGTQAAYYQRKVDEIRENYLRYMPAVIIQPTETQVIQSKEYKELNEKIEIYEAALKERNGELSKLRDEIEAMKAKEAVRESYDQRMTLFMKAMLDNPKIIKLLEEEGVDLKSTTND